MAAFLPIHPDTDDHEKFQRAQHYDNMIFNGYSQINGFHNLLIDKQNCGADYVEKTGVTAQLRQDLH